MRGVVSLAAALAVPLTVRDGSPFPGRELILVLTFVVILATLVVQGLSLPAVIRWLGIKADRLAESEERQARLQANRSALARIDELVASKDSMKFRPESAQRLRNEYEDRIRQLETNESLMEGRVRGLFPSDYDMLSRETLDIERKAILKLRDDLVINDEVLRKIQRDIDLAEARLGEPASESSTTEA
jgi:CPA1 family monovalent cation:H+ antiporter